MSGPRILPLGEARAQLRHSIGQLDALRWTLKGIELSLPEPLAEQVRLVEMSDEMDAVTELRTVIHCVLEDSLRPAVQDLQEVLASTGSNEEP